MERKQVASKHEIECPTSKEALRVLSWLLGKATYDDLDARTEDGAKKTLARWELARLAMKRLRADLRGREARQAKSR